MRVNQLQLKRLRCCSVKGRFKDCTATYKQHRRQQPLHEERGHGQLGARGPHGLRRGVGQGGVPASPLRDRHGVRGQKLRKAHVRSRKLYCGQEYIIENAVDEMRGSARECRWTKYFSKAPLPRAAAAGGQARVRRSWSAPRIGW